ncbi:autophagy protein [Moniliophthora roreri]|uniref:Autophagy-related protein 13 n=1 Tax=Moniliophthora roreri TaxID=221103 RepID=A0A0W0FWQ4_MONRR|nr:autophagy protein [Moniliophthora roreri]
MSNVDTQKADQIALHLYTKLFYVVNDARAISEPRTQPKIDKWFNLETRDSDLFTKEAKERYKSLSSSPRTPPLEIQVLLTIPDLTTNQVLVYNAPDTSRVRVEPTPRTILLERWILTFTPRDTRDDDDTDESWHVAPSTIYKHGIPLFRSLYSLLRILPTWKLCKRLRRRGSAQVNRGNGLSIQVRVREHDDHTMLDFGVPPSPSNAPLPTSAHSFPSVPLPMGSLTLTATYLSTPNFRLDDLESLLSSRFMNMDTGPEFTPTLVKNQQRDSLLSTHEGSPGSLPMRTSLPLSPPRDIVRPNPRLPSVSSTRPTSRATSDLHEDPDSIAERFVLPSRTASTGTSPPHQPRALPITRATTTTSTTTGSPSGLAARLRKESLQHQGRLGAATTSDSYLPGSTSSQPFPSSSSTTSVSSIPPVLTGGIASSATSQTSPISVRRPGLNPVNPFKSGTLSERTGTGNTSQMPSGTGTLGLGGGFGVAGGGVSGSPSSFSSSSRNQPPGGGASASPMSSTGLPSLPNFPRAGPPGSTAPHSPIIGSGAGAGTGTSYGSAAGVRPSPPFAPSSLGDRRSLASAEGAGSVSSTGGGGAEIPVPTRKRYSSSFGHRYSAGAGTAGSAGSGGSGGSGIVAGTGGGTGVGSIEGSPRGPLRELPGRHSRTSSLGQGVRVPIDKEKEGSSSFLGPATDDDEISVFVQDIDSRKPLSGRSKIFAKDSSLSSRDGSELPKLEQDPEPEQQSGHGKESTMQASAYSREPNISPTTSTHTGGTSGTVRMPSGTIGPSSPPTGSTPMLTTETEVDVKLKKMNEAFLASLEGLGGGSSSGSSRGAQRRGGTVESAESSPVSPSRPPLPPPSNFLGEIGGTPYGHYQSPSSGGSYRGRGSGRGSPVPSPLYAHFTRDRERRSSAASSVSQGQGSEEVIGRLELSNK